MKKTREKLDVAATRTLTQWPLLLALSIFAVGLAVAWFGHWRVGSFIIAAGIGVAGVLRATLPSAMAGLLVVRKRWFDATILLVSAFAVAILSIVIPDAKH